MLEVPTLKAELDVDWQFNSLLDMRFNDIDPSQQGTLVVA